MKNSLRICAAASVLLLLASLAHAQDGAARAEFDCLTLANSSAFAAHADASPFVSFHHVWTPGLDYGTFQSNGLNLVYETQGSGSDVVIVIHGGAGLPHEYF